MSLSLLHLGTNTLANRSFADLARYLRQGVGQEWRAELEATEFEMHFR